MEKLLTQWCLFLNLNVATNITFFIFILKIHNSNHIPLTHQWFLSYETKINLPNRWWWSCQQSSIQWNDHLPRKR